MYKVNFAVVSGEDLSKLGADMLLYKASAAHNLPVMCQALALGADKAWSNTEDHGRSHLHQAVISVSIHITNTLRYTKLFL